MIIVIVGPTGVGKTKLSVELAKKYNAIILNADAVQVYKELNIGSAKPSDEEKCGIKHILFDIKSINENYTVADYQIDLRQKLKEYENKNVILVGGTGLYVNAGLFDYTFDADVTDDEYSDLTVNELYKLALQKDKNAELDKNNKHRLIRFLKKGNTIKNGDVMLYDALFIGLKTDREVLYNNINKRVDNMIENGLIDEVKQLYDSHKDSRVLNSAIGYKELISYFKGNITLEESIDLIKKNSRRYAKRQFTWFNNKLNTTWFNVNYDDFLLTVSEVENYINKKMNN